MCSTWTSRCVAIKESKGWPVRETTDRMSLGIATIDRQPYSCTIAVWLTTRSMPLEARHTNAVVIDLVNDPLATKKVRSLTRCYVVLATEGSSLDGMPIDGKPMTVADMAGLLAEAEAQQVRILAAVDEFKQGTRSRNLVEPTFPVSPNVEDFVPAEDTASSRALATANYLRRVWTVWLKTDEQRRRRTVQPKTGKTPWIMPAALNGSIVPDFPAEFARRLRVQPLV